MGVTGLWLGCKWFTSMILPALQERKLALALAPNDPVGIASLAELAIAAGEPDEAIASLTSDIPWDPNYLFSSPYYRLGLAYFLKGDYQKGLEYLKQERHEDPINTFPILAATYAEMGSLEEACAIVAKMRAANSNATLGFMREVWSFSNEVDSDRFIGALRKAGLPE
jgi:tetratricopeptide (TPR) repeat protein